MKKVKSCEKQVFRGARWLAIARGGLPAFARWRSRQPRQTPFAFGLASPTPPRSVDLYRMALPCTILHSPLFILHSSLARPPSCSLECIYLVLLLYTSSLFTITSSLSRLCLGLWSVSI